MTFSRRTLSSLVASQLPEFVREDNQTFVAFLEAYYEYLQNIDGNDLKTIGDIDTTLDSFIKYFKNEVAINFPKPVIDERFLLQHMKDHYLAKGSEASFKFLFRVLFDKDVTIEYPSRQMLRASDGRWNQEVSIFAKINAGSPDDIVGRIVDVVTPNRIIRLQIDRRQYVEVEVNRSTKIADDIYEFFIDRKFFGDIAPGDRIRYSDIFDATIVPTTSRITIQQKGKNFKLGDLYELKNGNGVGSILKVSGVDQNGAITSIQFVKYGINYLTDFTATLLPIGGTSATLSGATGLTIGGTSPNYSVALTDTTNGFFEQGIINTTDYNKQTELESLAEGVGNAWDGTYVGDVVREFFVDNKYAILDADEPAIIKIALGSLAKYPGYYTSNLGFLDDAIYIQDSRFYQAFSYVIKIDEKLESYRSAIKTLIHPAGMALFGEYDIRNEFDTGTTLQSMLRFLVLQFQDEVKTADDISIKHVAKAISTHYLYDGTEDTASITLLDPRPDFNITKPLSTHYLYDGVTADTSLVTLQDTSRALNVGKLLSTHYLYDGVTADNNSVTPSESTISYGYSSLSRLGISTLNTTKVFNSPVYEHKLYDNTTLDTDTIAPTDALPNFAVTKPLSTHYLFDGTTADTSSVTMTESEFVISIVLNKQLGTHYLYNGVTADTNSVTMTGSGGGIWLNAYIDTPYPTSSSYFANDSGNYTTGEQTFTG
jgi:hypothetical protein